MKTNSELARIAFRYAGGFAALFLLWSTKLSAQKLQTEEKFVFNVIYQGSPGDYLVFKVNFTNAGNKKPVLKILDNNLAELYSESIIVESYARIIKIPKQNAADLEFRIYSGKEILKKAFEVKKLSKEFIDIIAKEG